jgi:hypothetical protein
MVRALKLGGNIHLDPTPDVKRYPNGESAVHVHQDYPVGEYDFLGL